MPAPCRPVPADFAEVFKNLQTIKAVAKHYNAGQKAVIRWRDQSECASRPFMRPVPADFVEVARDLNTQQIINHYQSSAKVVARWIAETGATSKKRAYVPAWNARPVPDDFALIAPTKTVNQLREHYNAWTEAIVPRWIKQSGVAAKRREKPVGQFFTSRQQPTKVENNRPWTPHTHAVSVLQRERFAVFHCDERGRADQLGKFWRVGTVICDGDELLARAARYERRAA